MKVKELTRGHNNLSMDLEIDMVGKTNQKHKGYGEDYTFIQTIVKDDTGDIKMTFWDEDVPEAKEGRKFKITDGYVTEFHGQLQLNVGKKGKIEWL